MITPTSCMASDAIELIAQGIVILEEQDYDYDLNTIACQLLQTMGSLTDEYPMEYFTDEEIDLITATTMACLSQLMTQTEQGEF